MAFFCCKSIPSFQNINNYFRAMSLIFLSWIGQASAQTTFYPATGIYNGFLNQINILECDNSGLDPLNPVVRILSLEGKELSAIPMRIEASGTQHIILNDLVQIRDTYGTYKIELSNDEMFKGSQLSCRTTFYRPAVNQRLKSFDFAYALPVRNPDSGERSGAFNSFNPSESAEPTYNWLSLVNLDKSLFSADIFLYDAAGSIIEKRAVENISPASRIDIPLGHDKGQVVGTYRIVPRDMNLNYQAFVIRYGAFGDSFRFAFPLQAVAGSCSGNLIQLSTMGSPNTANWLEIVNLNPISIPVQIIIRDRGGNELQNSNISLPAFAQHHVFANAIIDPSGTGNVGSAQVLCEDPSDKVLTQSLFYGRAGNLELSWAYASQDFGFSGVTKGSRLVTPINTFLGMSNWVKLANSSVGALASYSSFNNAGQELSRGEYQLHPNTTADLGIHGEVPPDTIGSTVISSDSNNSLFSGELLRIVPDTRGEIGSIIQIPGIVQRGGISNQVTSTGSRASGFIGQGQSLSQYRNDLTYEEAHHLLTRVGFGASDGEIRRAQKEGLEATVRRIMTFVEDPEVETQARRFLNNNVNVDSSIINHIGAQKYWMYHMVHGESPFRERMAMIWHDLFAASCLVVQDNRINNTCYFMLDTFRTNALGNYKTIAQEMTRDFVMLHWLNGNSNRKGTPDENYAREFWELFSLGEPTKHKGRFSLYTSEDILESSRAFTGWTTPRPGSQRPDIKPVFVQSRFDDGIKTIFEGTPFESTGAFNDFDVVERTLDRPESAEWLVKRLFSALVHDHPSPLVVNELASLLRASNLETEPVVRRILLSEALFSTEAQKSRVKDAVTFTIGFIRSSGIPVNINELFNRFNNNGLGFQPLYPPSVNGWPLNKYEGAYLSQFFLGWSLNYTNVIRYILNRAPVAEPGFTYANLIPFETESIEDILKSAERLVDHWSFVLGIELTKAQRDTLIEYMHSQRSSNGTVSVTPFSPQNNTQVRQKIPGLLWLLAQHEDYKTF
jgi:uncharacterized protein (DUF1800 family)